MYIVEYRPVLILLTSTVSNMTVTSPPIKQTKTKHVNMMLTHIPMHLPILFFTLIFIYNLIISNYLRYVLYNTFLLALLTHIKRQTISLPSI
jgi:hypothetical protein